MGVEITPTGRGNIGVDMGHPIVTTGASGIIV